MFRFLFSCVLDKKRKTRTVSELRSRGQRLVSPRLGSGKIAFYFERQDLVLESNEWVNVTEDETHYRRDSFEDRFGDDLSELVLSFLDLEDKIRLQWVCPQFRRTIFGRVTELSVLPFLYHSSDNRYFASADTSELSTYRSMKCVDLFRLVPVLTVAPNILFITGLYDLDNTEEVMEAVIDFCYKLRAIETDFQITNKTLAKFLKKFGPNMKKIIFCIPMERHEYIHILKACPNIEIIGRSYLMDSKLDPLFDGEQLLVKNLKIFHFCSYQKAERIGIVLKNNRATLKSIGIMIWDSSHKLFKEVWCLSKLKKLFINTLCNKEFVECITKLSTNCPNLKKMKVSMESSTKESPDWQKFFAAVNELTTLTSFRFHQSLYFHERCSNTYPLISESLCDLKNLISLKIVGNCFAIDDLFFASIHLNLPKLQKIFLQCRHISKFTTRSVAKLRHLRSLILCQIIESYLSDTWKHPEEYEHRPDLLKDEDVIELIVSTRKLQRIFLTTPSPGRLTCDLSDGEIETIRESDDFDTTVVFFDDGEEDWDRKNWARSANMFDRKFALTSANWML